MAELSAGRLISVEAIRARDALGAARNLLRKKRPDEGGFTTWDASGIFFQVEGVRREIAEQPSAQTLLLLYAADLRFRLRWEIEPAMLEGKTVIAVPYVETGIIFGRALGLPDKWVSEIFRFAPEPNTSYWVDGSFSAQPSPKPGFLEYYKDLLPADFPELFASHFTELESRRKSKLLPF